MMGFLTAMMGIVFSVAMTVAVTMGYLDRENPPSARAAAAQVGLYRIFMLAASQYVTANPSVSGTVPWSTLKTQNTTPDSMKGANLSDAWKLVADGQGNFVVCAPLSEATVAALGQLMPSTYKPTRTTFNSQDYVWLGDVSQLSQVTQC